MWSDGRGRRYKLSVGERFPSDKTTLSRELSTAVDVVRALTSGLRAGNAEQVRRHRWGQPRPLGERDLLSDMAAADGLPRAVKRLSPFWRGTEIRFQGVRRISELEAEVYDVATAPRGEMLPIVSLVRRQSPGHAWQVVCVNESHHDRLTFWVTCDADVIDGRQWTEHFSDAHGAGAELVMDGGEGVVGHPERGWLASLRGPFTPDPWPSSLPLGQTMVVELSLVLERHRNLRRDQLHWFARLADVTATVLRADTIFLPAHEKLVLPDMLWRAARRPLGPPETYRLWAQLEELHHHYYTTGLRILGLPEVEAPVSLLPQPERSRRLLVWLATELVGGKHPPAVGTEIRIGPTTLRVESGRRGPRVGRTYGQWGSLRIEPQGPSARRPPTQRLRFEG